MFSSFRNTTTVLAGSESSSNGLAWVHYGLGRVAQYVGQKVRPRGSGEKRAEDELPSWRSMRSLTVKETALGLRSGSLAANGETSRSSCSSRAWVSRRIERVICAKAVAAIRKSARLKSRSQRRPLQGGRKDATREALQMKILGGARKRRFIADKFMIRYALVLRGVTFRTDCQAPLLV
jgi:hypothetical protein